MKNNSIKRLLSLILAMLMMVSIAPVSVFSDDIEAVELYSEEKEEEAPAEDNSTVLAEEPAEAEPVQEAETPESSEQSAEIAEATEGTDVPEEAEEETEEAEEPEEEQAPFEQSVQFGDVIITVTAEAGAFPENATLFAEKVPVWTEEAAAIDEAVSEVRDESKEVKEKYTFDIKILLDGEEIEPAEGKSVNVKFSLAKAKEDDMQIDVYHIVETPATEDNSTDAEAVAEETAGPVLEAVQLSTEINTNVPEYGIGTEVTVATESFSYYVVEFTYNGKTYVMEGGTVMPLREILDYLEIPGESITDIEISNEELVTAAQDEDGEWYVISLQPFTTEEWMKLSVDGERYEIKLTDAISKNNYSIVYGSSTDTAPATFGNGANTAVTVTFMANPDNPVSEKNYIGSGSRGNGILIRSNSTVVLYIAKGFTLNVEGGNGYYSNGGGAAIYLTSSSKLFVIGPGKLVCQGGKAGAGSSGGSGSSGEMLSGGWMRGGTGGNGGSGGGGAGAGIGTDGGYGGDGGSGGTFLPPIQSGYQTKDIDGRRYVYCFINRDKSRGTYEHSSDRNGNNGSRGSTGSDSNTAGKVYFLYNNSKYSKTITDIKGGAANDTHGSFGNNATFYSRLSKNGNDYGYGGGGGGGGGQGGRRAYDIGQGGYGGAGGGGGGSGGTFLGNISSDYPPVGGYGGSFLSGYDVRGYYGIEAYGAKGGTGGHAGAASSNRFGIQSGKEEDVNIDPYNSGSADIKENIEYTIDLISQNNKVGQITAYYGFGFPQQVDIPNKTGDYKNLVFFGYYTGKDGAGTQIFDAAGKATDNFYALADKILNTAGHLELYAFWETVVAGIGYTYYQSLEAAVNAAKFGDTIKMYANVDLKEKVVFNSSVNLKLDLNGCEIRANCSDCGIEVGTNVSLDIINSDQNDGIIQNIGKGDRIAIINNGGWLDVRGDHVKIIGRSTEKGSGFAIENRKGSTYIFNGTLEGHEFNGTTAAGLWVSGGSAILIGGTLIGTGDRTVSACCVYATGGETTIDSGSYTGTVHGIYVNGADATVNIDKNPEITITGKGEQKRQEEKVVDYYHGYGVYVKSGHCNINGGIINGYSAGVCSEVSNGITINNLESHVQYAVEKDTKGNNKPSIEGDKGTTVVNGGYFGTNVQYWCADAKYCYHVNDVGRQSEYNCSYVVLENSGNLKITGQNETYSGSGIKGYTVTGSSAGYSFTCYYTGFDDVTNQVYQRSTDMPVNCGEYKAEVIYSKSGTPGTASVEFEILPADLKIIPNPGMKKTFGQADPPLEFSTNSLKTDGDRSEFETFKSNYAILLRKSGEDAGFYPYYVNHNNDVFIKTGEHASNYKPITIDEGSSGEQFEIVGLDINVEKWPKEIHKTYDGVTAELLDPFGTVSKEHSSFASFYYSTDGINFSPDVPKAKDADNYTISYYVHSNNRSYRPVYKDNITGNYFTVTSIIDKADPVYWPPDNRSLVYNGNMQNLVIQRQDPLYDCTMEYSLALGEEAVWSEYIPRAREVGTYTVYYRVVGNKNCKGVPESEENKVVSEISKAPVPVLDLRADDLIYGDELFQSEISNVPEGWTAHWENGTQMLPAGTHGCNAVVEGPDNKSYETKTVAVNVTVHPRETQIYWNWNNNKDYYVYDGKEHCPDAKILNLLPGDECLIKYEGAAIDIGKHTAFIKSISNSNYVLPEEGSQNYQNRFCEFEIKSWEYIYGEDTYGVYDGTRKYKITMNNVPSNAGQNYRWAEVTKINLTEAEIKAITSWSDNTTNPEFIGGPDKTYYYCVQYKITAGGRTFEGVNYVVIYSKGSLPVIETLPLADNRTFDGTAKKTITTEATATYKGQSCGVEYAVASMDNLSEIVFPKWQSYENLDTKRDAGYYFTMVRAFADDGGVIKYSDIGVVESYIKQKELNVQWKKDAASEPETVGEFVYQYDGQEHRPVPEGKSGDIVDKEKLQFIVAPASSVNVGKYTATAAADGEDKDNYMLISSPQKYRIEGQAVVVKAPEALEPIYNEKPQALVEPGEAENGTMYYSLDNKTWSADVPEKKDSGHYEVFYMVKGSEGYSDYYAQEPVHVRFWPKIIYDIKNAADNTTVAAVYDERLTESVIVDKNLTIDMRGHTVTSAENATLIVNPDVTLELTNTYKGVEGGFVNTAEGKAAAAVSGTLNVNNSYAVLKGSTAVKCESGGKVLISNGRISGALEAAEGGNLKAKGGFYSGAVEEKYLFSQKITDQSDINKTALCFNNGREDTKEAYPFRVSTARVAASNLMIGAGTTVRIYIHLDGDEDDVWSFEVRRENTGSGQSWIEHPELSEEKEDIFYNGKVWLPYIEFSGVNPQCMSNNVETFIYLNGEQAYYTGKFSVKEYSAGLYNTYGGAAPQLDELVANMLEYGAAAQEYKNYNKENMANDNQDIAAHKTEYVKPTEYMSQFSRIEKVPGYEQYRLKNVGLLFGDRVKLYFTFLQSIDSKDLVIEIDGKEVSKYSDYNKYVSSGYYGVFSEDISLTDISKVVEVVMYYKGVETDRMTFSPGLYIQLYGDSSVNPTIRPMVKRYYEFAKSGIKYEEG